MFYTLLYKFAPNSLSVNIILMICTAIYAILHYIIFNGIVKLPVFIMKYSYAFYGIVIIDLAVFLYLYKKEMNETLAQIDAKSQQLDEIIQRNVSLNKSQMNDINDKQSEQQIENNNKQIMNNGIPAMMQQNMMNPQLSNGMNPAMMQQLIQQQMMQQRMNQMNQQINNVMNPNMVQQNNVQQNNIQQNNQKMNQIINNSEINQQNNQQIQKKQMIVQHKESEQEQEPEPDQESESIVIERKTNEQQPTKDTIINNQSDDETSEKNETNENSDEIDGESINKN